MIKIKIIHFLLIPPFPLEPILFRLLIEYEDGDIMRYYGLFDPKSALPPRGGGCEALYEINDGVGGEIVSGLSFIVVSCGGWEYYDGDKSIVGMEVYYKTQDGDKYPRNQTGKFFSYSFGLFLLIILIILFYFILFYFILFYFILFYFILFYFILFYFILFYFILFYFILFMMMMMI